MMTHLNENGELSTVMPGCHFTNVARVHHDDVIKWKHFPRYWPFVQVIHRSPVNSPHKRPVRWSFGVFFHLRLNKRMSKQSRRRWFGTPSRSLWYQCYDNINRFQIMFAFILIVLIQLSHKYSQATVVQLLQHMPWPNVISIWHIRCVFFQLNYACVHKPFVNWGPEQT